MHACAAINFLTARVIFSRILVCIFRQDRQGPRVITLHRYQSSRVYGQLALTLPAMSSKVVWWLVTFTVYSNDNSNYNSNNHDTQDNVYGSVNIKKSLWKFWQIQNSTKCCRPSDHALQVFSCNALQNLRFTLHYITLPRQLTSSNLGCESVCKLLLFTLNIAFIITQPDG